MAADQAQERIAAVVVTYNRKALLLQCLESLLAQTHAPDAIYVVDNRSSDGTYDLLRDRHLIDPVARDDSGSCETVRLIALPALPARQVRMHYVRLPENTGGAGGFHEGMKRAAEAGFDWLWLMDDDLVTSPEALAALVRKKVALSAVHGRSILLNSLVLSKDHADDDALAFPLQELSRSGYPKVGVYHWRLSEVRDKLEDGLYRWACPFNGTFVPAAALSQIGLPNADFFIRGDEMDFLWRAAKHLSLYTVIDSKVFHPRPRTDAFDWRQYYIVRNMFFVNRHFNFTTARNLRLILLSLLKGLCHGRQGTRLVLRAVRDGLTGRLGKREEYHP